MPDIYTCRPIRGPKATAWHSKRPTGATTALAIFVPFTYSRESKATRDGSHYGYLWWEPGLAKPGEIPRCCHTCPSVCVTLDEHTGLPLFLRRVMFLEAFQTVSQCRLLPPRASSSQKLSASKPSPGDRRLRTRTQNDPGIPTTLPGPLLARLRASRPPALYSRPTWRAQAVDLQPSLCGCRCYFPCQLCTRNYLSGTAPHSRLPPSC